MVTGQTDGADGPRRPLSLAAPKRALARLIVRSGWSRLLFPFFERAMLAESNPSSGATTVLAINPSRFRNDLEILEASGRVRVLRMPFEWQARLIPYFYGPTRDAEAIFQSAPSIADAQDAYRRFLRGILRRLVDRNGIDVVVGAAVHFVQDLDWGATAHQLGVPYVVFHRESMVTSPALRVASTDRYRRLAPFQGDHIATANAVMRDVFVDSGFARPEQVSVVGVTRMDAFVHRVKSVAPERHGRVALFSFHHATGFGPKTYDASNFKGVWSADGSAGYVRMFDAVHGAIARLAQRRPDIEFVVKPKWGGEEWPGRIRQAFEAAGVDHERLGNLRIDWDADAHDLILRSDVVSGYGSTTVLEAAIAGKPVVVPGFEEAADPANADIVPFREEQASFDVARSVEQYEQLIELRLHSPEIDAECMALRRAAFERYVSSLDAVATEQHIEVLETQAKRRSR